MYWIEYGTFITQRDQNVFLPYEARVVADGQFALPALGHSELVSKSELAAPVIAVKPSGSVWLDVQEDKLSQLGIRANRPFLLTFAGKAVQVISPRVSTLSARCDWHPLHASAR